MVHERSSLLSLEDLQPLLAEFEGGDFLFESRGGPSKDITVELKLDIQKRVLIVVCAKQDVILSPIDWAVLTNLRQLLAVGSEGKTYYLMRPGYDPSDYSKVIREML